MKQAKRTYLISLVAGCGLLAALSLGAQDTNLEPAKADGAAINTADPDQPAARAEMDPADSPPEQESEGDAFRRRFDSERNKGSIYRNAVVMMGKDVVLKSNETAEAVVVIGGSARILGKVRHAVVVIGGDAEIEGEVGDAVVAVLGSIKAGPNAKVYDALVAVGGKVDVAEGAAIHGQTQEVDFAPLGLELGWLRKWFQYCALRLRPLAPQVGWVWIVAGIFLLVYILISAIFPRPVQACVDELTRRPATTFVMGLFTKLLLPLVFLILIATGVGLFVLPFVWAALIFGAMVGKTAILQLLGFKIGRQFSGDRFSQPLLALLVGAAVISLLYMVPILGLLTFGILSVWGLGGAVTAAFGGLRKEMPEKQSPPPPAAPAPPSGQMPPVAPSTEGPAPVGYIPDPIGQPSIPIPPPGVSAASVPEDLAYPRAGFWVRMAAGVLDAVLVGMVGGFIANMGGGPPLAFLVALAYFSGMWAWKGTTIGGIVVGLKVVRMDGKPMTFTVALVRGLAAAFSIMVLFLGILWIAWDNEKQGWHDRIAGTYVLRLPRGTPLLCV